jgi:hypothetical protein
MGVQALETRQKGWMDVDQPVAPLGDEPGRQQPHKSRKGDEFDTVCFQLFIERPLKGFPVARKAFVVDGGGIDAEFGGPFQTGRSGPV